MTDHLITTTMQPGKVVSVDDQELEDLTRMGVVASLVPSGLEQVPAPIRIPPVAGAMQAGGPTVEQVDHQEVESSGDSEEAAGEASGA
jgi:hypothetical protein